MTFFISIEIISDLEIFLDWAARAIFFEISVRMLRVVSIDILLVLAGFI